MQILDMERETGLDRATIRFYEKEGIVVPQRKKMVIAVTVKMILNCF